MCLLWKCLALPEKHHVAHFIKLRRCGEQPTLYSWIHTHILSQVFIWGGCGLSVPGGGDSGAGGDGAGRGRMETKETAIWQDPSVTLRGEVPPRVSIMTLAANYAWGYVCSTLLTSPLFCLSWECNFRPLYLMFSLLMFVHVHCHGAMVNGKPVGLNGLQAPSFFIISMLIWF